jgi:hypothetical protein
VSRDQRRVRFGARFTYDGASETSETGYRQSCDVRSFLRRRLSFGGPSPRTTAELSGCCVRRTVVDELQRSRQPFVCVLESRNRLTWRISRGSQHQLSPSHPFHHPCSTWEPERDVSDDRTHLTRTWTLRILRIALRIDRRLSMVIELTFGRRKDRSCILKRRNSVVQLSFEPISQPFLF